VTAERAATARDEPASSADLASRVARLFFERQLTKVEIATRLGVSRFRVARLLDQALADGSVRIEFRGAPARDRDLGEQVAATYGLEECIVAASGADAAAVARLGADVVDGLVGRGDAIGIAWGSTVASVVRAMPARDDATIDVVQLAGSSTYLEAATDPGDLTRVLAERLGGRPYRIHAPAFVESAALRDALMGQREIAETVGRFRGLAVAILGIGAFGSGGAVASSSLLRSGSLGPGEVRRLAGLGAVGDLLVHPFTAGGVFVAADLADRAIAISIDQLRRVPHVVAVAAGAEKIEAMRGALLTGIVGILVTDAAAAMGLLA
jgi:DNA-binding transcriptional regulator LsrR (DeoR family)